MNFYQEANSSHIMNLQEVCHQIEKIKAESEINKNNFIKKLYEKFIEQFNSQMIKDTLNNNMNTKDPSHIADGRFLINAQSNILLDKETINMIESNWKQLFNNKEWNYTFTLTFNKEKIKGHPTYYYFVNYYVV